MHLGEIEILYLDGGGFALDGGAMFGVVPKVLWEKKSPPDENNRIRMRANSLLVRSGGKTIVIETATARSGTGSCAPFTLSKMAILCSNPSRKRAFGLSKSIWC